MCKKHLYFILLSVFFFSACKKSKTKKKIVGHWEVSAMYTDYKDFLLIKRKGKILPQGCDTISFERTETLKSEITFNENGNYKRLNNITINYLDTAATRIQCAAVFADSMINSAEEGTWRFEGKETLELIAQNKNYEGNKLVAISDNEMEWQTDLTVEQGFVIFKGIKTTKLVKR
jgi:hypothetical protein